MQTHKFICMTTDVSKRQTVWVFNYFIDLQLLILNWFMFYNITTL